LKQAAVWLVLFLAVSACDGNGRGADPAGEDNRPVSTGLASSASHVDSAIPIDEALRRFRRDVPKTEELRGGFPSREKLVREFTRALEARDTASLRRMVLKPDEFAWLYYPSSPLSRPPYELAPALMWFQLQGESEKGASRLLTERAGRRIRYVDHVCAPARIEGRNRIHSHCELRYLTPAGDTIAERLFGLIVEREGSHKFVSYANRLD
jgi:ribosomal protein S21